MNFKLQYQTSDTSPFEPHEIIANIQLELGDKKYNVGQVTDRSVTFKDNPWRIQYRGAPARLPGGEFVITDDPINGRTVTLYYYYNFLWPVLAIIGLTIAMISQKVYWQMLAFDAFFCVALTFDNWRVKSKAKELLTAVV